MKITHVIFAMNIGGAEVMLVDLLNQQVKKQSVSLIVINSSICFSLLDKIDNQVKIVLIGRKEKSRSLLPIIKLNWYLLRIMPDIIHCHNHAVIKMIVLKNNAVLTVHDVNVPTNNFKDYKKIFAISNAVKNNIEKRSSINPILVYNGIKVESINIKEDYTFNIFRIIQVSRLDHNKKGQHILLKALKILVYDRKIKNIKVDFIGEGESLFFLKDLVLEYQLQNYVNFKGSCHREFIYEHLNEYCLLIQPSMYEGFGLAIAEAMVAKLPVLVSDIDGPLEIVGNGEYGYVFKKGDVQSLVNKINHIYLNYSSIRTIIDKAHDWCIKKFSIKKMTQNYINNY